MKHSVKLEIEIYKISRRRSRSSDNVVWSFHVVDFQRKQRNLQRFLTHVHSHCSAHSTFLFSDVSVVVVVVVFLNSLIRKCFFFHILVFKVKCFSVGVAIDRVFWSTE